MSARTSLAEPSLQNFNPHESSGSASRPSLLPVLRSNFQFFIRSPIALVTALAIAALHYFAWVFFLFAESDGGFSWAVLPSHILSLPLLLPSLLLLGFIGLWRWTPESIELLLVLANSLIWGVAVTVLIRCILAIVRPTTRGGSASHR